MKILMFVALLLFYSCDSSSVNGNLDVITPKVNSSIPAGKTLMQALSSDLLNSEGRAVDAKSFESDYYLVYFSASWCPPCRAFTPKLVEQQSQIESFGARLLLAGADKSEGEMLKYMQQYKMAWPGIYSGKAMRYGFGMYAERGIPSLALIDKQGGLLIKGGQGELPKILQYLQQHGKKKPRKR